MKTFSKANQQIRLSDKPILTNYGVTTHKILTRLNENYKEDVSSY